MHATIPPELDLPQAWPPLPLADWKETYATLHLWTQIVGKVRLTLAPPVNHYWHSTLYPSLRGLSTGPIPCRDRLFEIEFDFLQHTLWIRDSRGATQNLALAPKSVADFYAELFRALKAMEIEVSIHARPDEVPNPIPFAEDRVHAQYNPEPVGRLARILQTVSEVFQVFRSPFLGKCSPVHFFWGSFDLAVTRFSGKRAPERPGADAITRESYSHEVISAGFWPGAGAIDYPAFYAYAAPAPEGLADAALRPSQSFYHREMGEFLLRYDDVRQARSPTAALLEFLESTYAAAAERAGWDRAALERRG